MMDGKRNVEKIQKERSSFSFTLSRAQTTPEKFPPLRSQQKECLSTQRDLLSFYNLRLDLGKHAIQASEA